MCLWWQRSNGLGWTLSVCGPACTCCMCVNVSACWVALCSPRLSAGSVGFGVDCDVTADLLFCGPSHVNFLLCPCVLQGRVVENISKRCGGFLRQLSLRGCLSVGDASMKWDSHCFADTHWCNECACALTFTKSHPVVALFSFSLVSVWLYLKFKQLVLLHSQGILLLSLI